MKHLDLFSGIGGFSLAARWVWGEEHTPIFCEVDKFCQKILKKHWPDAAIFEDIRRLYVDIDGNFSYLKEIGKHESGEKRESANSGRTNIDLLTGGFP